MHIILLHFALSVARFLLLFFCVIPYIPHTCNYTVIIMGGQHRYRLRPLWQPAMHLIYYYCCVSSVFYWRINVELRL